MVDSKDCHHFPMNNFGLASIMLALMAVRFNLQASKNDPENTPNNTDGYFSLVALEKSFGILSRGTKLKVDDLAVVSATTSDSVKAMQESKDGFPASKHVATRCPETPNPDHNPSRHPRSPSRISPLDLFLALLFPRIQLLSQPL